ncbi:hypothetical protein [Desertivirga xinjiangensis]|uniref:hypothetical protein n=1 Tax=Desertivirga xinjiangensis TaxID=539206 RepID=UPI00210B547D|nr:hypothetical protein [Pedobacter xinjiangensis]
MKSLFALVFIIFSCSTFAQTIENPRVQSSEDPTTQIIKVERNAKYTILTFEHAQTEEAGWITLNKGIYLQDYDGHEMYKFIKCEGIPLMPEKKELAAGAPKFTFKVYFEKVPASVKRINVIERATPKTERGSYFNYFGLSLSESDKGENGPKYQI